MARRLPKYGFDVTVYTSSSPVYTPELDVVQVSHPTIIRPPKRNYAACLSYWVSLYRKLLKNNYDVIDANGHMSLVPCSLASKRTGKPVIATIHDLYFGDWRQMQNGLGGFLGLPFELMSAKMPFDKVITLNTTVKDKMKDILKMRNADVIPSGIDTKEIDGVRGVEKRDNKILYAGRLVPQKNVDLLIRAFGTLEGAELEIIGEGSEKKRLERLADSLGAGKKIKFLHPYKSHGDLIKSIKSATMLVLPSKRENFGIVPLESMRCGTAVISTKTDGPKDYIQNGVNGFLTETGDETELANKIQLLLNDEKLRKKFERNGRRTSESYDWDTIVRRIGKEYKMLV